MADLPAALLSMLLTRTPIPEVPGASVAQG
jgi:hypothetical protein